MGNVIVVVGAGIGGLSCALALQRVGRPVLVLEQTQRLAEVGAGIGLWPGAVSTLGELGVDVGALRHCPFRWAETATPDGRVLTGFDISAMTAQAPGFVARRADLLGALAALVDPAAIRLGAQVTALRQQHDRVVLALAGGRTITADVVVGADGLQSVVRGALHGSASPRYGGETCYRALTRFRVADPGMVREVQGAGRRCAVHPIDTETVYWWAARRAPAGIVETPTQRHAVLTELFAGWASEFPEALAATDPTAILKHDLGDRPPLRRWSVGRVTLLGDAAHPTTPNLGLGGCMAIEDGLVLARAFAENGGKHAPAFRQYERERHGRTSRVVRMSRRYGRLGALSGDAAVRLRDGASRMMPDRLMQAVFRRQVAFQPGPLRR